MIPTLQAGGMGRFDIERDHFRNYLAFCLPMNGANAGTTFTDHQGATVTVVGNAQTSTAQSKWAGSSGLFDGTGDYLTVPNNANYYLQAGDFTIEAWIYPTTLPSSGDWKCITSKWGDGTGANRSWSLLINNTAGVYKLYFSISLNGTTQINAITDTITIATNTWYHVAVSRNGANIKAYLNGVHTGTTYNISTNSLYSQTNDYRIGSSTATAGAALYEWIGHLQDVRHTHRVGRYPNNFNPPYKAFPKY